MNNIELRKKYGDHPENPIYTYPDHYFANKDGFTMHITNWLTFLSKFANVPNLQFLEIGTGNGRSSVWTFENILTHPSSKLITVDITENLHYKKGAKFKGMELEEDILVSVRQNLQPYIDQNKCEYVLEDSKLFLKKFNPTMEKILDFVYIDGCHEPDHIIYESCLCFEMLKPGGYLLFDDYGWGNCRYGIESFLLCYQSKIKVLYKDWQVLVEKL